MLPASTNKCHIKCMYLIFNLKNITPIVYKTPPVTKKIIPVGLILENIGLAVNTTSQPIIIYKTSDILCHLLRFIELNTIPRTDKTPIIPNNTHPKALPSKDKHTGM